MTREPLRSEKHDRTVVVFVGPDYDSPNDESLAELRNHLLSHTTSGDALNLVVDLSHTKFIGSGFIEVLFRVSNRIKRSGGTFALSSLQRYPEEVIRVSKLDGIWPLYRNVQEAIQGIAELENSTP